VKHWRDVTVVAALLVIALLPAGAQLTSRPPPAFGPVARTRLAWEVLNRRALSAGEIPLWNPHQFGGRPHLADPDTLALYPPHLLLRLLPLHLMFPVSFALHAWAAGVGAYFAARWAGSGRAAAVAVAGTVLLAGVMTPRPEIAYSWSTIRLAWLPLIAAFSVKSLRHPGRLPHPALVAVATLAAAGSMRGLFYAGLTVTACYLGAAWFHPAVASGKALARQAAWLAVLVCGLASYQLLPALRMIVDAAQSDGWTDDRVSEGSRHAAQPVPLEPSTAITAALTARGQGRVLSTCDRLLDGSQLVAAGLRGIDGYGGVAAGDFGRVVNLARGPAQKISALYFGIPEAGGDPSRADLLRLLGVDYLVTCETPDPSRWSLVSGGPDGGVYYSGNPAPRAAWTCAPRTAGRREIENRLRRSSYDGSLSLRSQAPVINVRWAPALDDHARTLAESELGLVPQQPLGDHTWQYELRDASPGHVTALVADPRVEDTAHIDRRAGVVETMPPDWNEPRDQWLMGAEPCDDSRTVAVQEDGGGDGQLTAAVEAPRAGIVFFSEVFYPERRAWVDGREVTPLKVDLAFLAVPVPAGRHFIEIRDDARVFRAGVAISLATLAGWILIARRRGQSGDDHRK
jgi:hypothetical protein